MTTVLILLTTATFLPPPQPISAFDEMALTYYGGPTGSLTGGNSYSFQVTGYDKDKGRQNGVDYLEGNWAHSASIDFSAYKSILSGGSITFEEPSSSLPNGTMRWEISGTIVNPHDGDEPITETRYLRIVNTDGISNWLLDDSDCSLAKEFTVIGH